MMRFVDEGEVNTRGRERVEVKEDYKTPTPPKPLPNSFGADIPNISEPKVKYFWKVFAIVSLVVISIISGYYIALLSDGVLKPSINFTTSPDNYEFNNQFDNPTNNKFYNNNSYNINFDLSEELVTKLCNGS